MGRCDVTAGTDSKAMDLLGDMYTYAGCMGTRGRRRDLWRWVGCHNKDRAAPGTSFLFSGDYGRIWARVGHTRGVTKPWPMVRAKIYVRLPIVDNREPSTFTSPCIGASGTCSDHE